MVIVVEHAAAWKVKTFMKDSAKLVVGSCIAGFFGNYQPVFADTIAPSLQSQIQELQEKKGIVIPVEVPSLKDQLKDIQKGKVDMQRAMKDADEQAQLTRQLTYPEGRVIARGFVSLEVKPEAELGYYTASELDPVYGTSEDSTLFILGVGRDGPPLAARRYKLNDIKFPLTFELTTDDLLFPYNTDAWLKSDARKDSIATTALISTGNSISKPTQTERFGFGLSDPVLFAGQMIRSSAKMNVVGKVDGNLYTPDDVALLSGIDKGLDEKAAAAMAKKK